MKRFNLLCVPNRYHVKDMILNEICCIFLIIFCEMELIYKLDSGIFSIFGRKKWFWMKNRVIICHIITLKRYLRAKNRKDKISWWCSTKCTSRRIGRCNSWNDLYNGWLVQKQFDGMHHSQHHVSMVCQYDDILRTFIWRWWAPRLRNQVLNPGHSHISYDFFNTLG